jgi:hypothetical protein
MHKPDVLDVFLSLFGLYSPSPSKLSDISYAESSMKGFTTKSSISWPQDSPYTLPQTPPRTPNGSALQVMKSEEKSSSLPCILPFTPLEMESLLPIEMEGLRKRSSYNSITRRRPRIDKSKEQTRHREYI